MPEGYEAVVTSIYPQREQRKGRSALQYDIVLIVCREQLHSLETPHGMCSLGQKLLVMTPRDGLGRATLVMLGNPLPYTPYNPRSR